METEGLRIERATKLISLLPHGPRITRVICRQHAVDADSFMMVLGMELPVIQTQARGSIPGMRIGGLFSFNDLVS